MKIRRRLPLVILVERRMSQIRRGIEKEHNLDSQDLRDIWIHRLDILFEMASDRAEGKKTKNDDEGKGQIVTAKERQLWAHVAAHIGLVMGNLTKGYDETKFNEDLARVENQLNEIKKYQAESVRQGNTGNQPVQADKTKTADQKIAIPSDPVFLAQALFGFNAKEYQAEFCAIKVNGLFYGGAGKRAKQLL